MSRALYVVILSRGRWWVDFEGRAFGPFETKDLASAEAKHLAQYQAHSGRTAEVLVPDDSGRHRVTWTSTADYAATPRKRAAE